MAAARRARIAGHRRRCVSGKRTNRSVHGFRFCGADVHRQSDPRPCRAIRAPRQNHARHRYGRIAADRGGDRRRIRMALRFRPAPRAARRRRHAACGAHGDMGPPGERDPRNVPGIRHPLDHPDRKEAGQNDSMSRSRSRIVLVILALSGFAANSLLCREALRAPATIDAVSFATIRLASGAIVLVLLSAFSSGLRRPEGTWLSALMLFAYAIAFSLAYIRLTVGTGALLLFGAVQLTMMGAGLGAGERLRIEQWLGFLLAVGGVITLSWRGVTAPDPLAAALMVVAGIAWG